jgi:hypothetical protein
MQSMAIIQFITLSVTRKRISNQPEADKYRIYPPLADKEYPISKFNKFAKYEKMKIIE